MKEYKINPDLEKCLPPLSDIEFTKLKLSIETQGYDEAKPIVLWKEFPDTIVDGHHRYKICRELGIEPVYIVKSFDSLDKAILYTLQRQIEQRNLHKEPWQKAPATPSWSCQKYYRVKPEPTILHGFIDPTTLHPTDMPFTVFRPYQATSKDIPCTLTILPDA